MLGIKFLLVLTTVIVFAIVAAILTGNDYANAERTGWTLRAVGCAFLSLGFIFVLTKIGEFFIGLEEMDNQEKDCD